MSSRFCLPKDAEIKGIYNKKGAMIPILEITKCDQNFLQPGLKCMEKDKLNKYFGVRGR